MPKIILPDLPPIPVTAQPKGRDNWVSNNRDELTQFDQVWRAFQSYGMLAHSYGAGKHFNNLKPGDIIKYVTTMPYRGKEIPNHKEFKVKEIRQFQAAEPNNVHSPFLDLATNKQYSANDLSKEVYGKKGRMVLQTCIEKDGEKGWGRKFVIAE